MATFTYEQLAPTLGDNRTVYDVKHPFTGRIEKVLLNDLKSFTNRRGEESMKYTTTLVQVHDGVFYQCKGVLPPLPIEDIISLSEEQPLEPLYY